MMATRWCSAAWCKIRRPRARTSCPTWEVPVIGFFFKGKFKDTKQSSLLNLVTPDIIDGSGARFFDVASGSKS